MLLKVIVIGHVPPSELNYYPECVSGRVDLIFGYTDPYGAVLEVCRDCATVPGYHCRTDFRGMIYFLTIAARSYAYN